MTTPMEVSLNDSAEWLRQIAAELKRAQDWRELQASPHIRDRCVIMVVYRDMTRKKVKHYECVPEVVARNTNLGLGQRGLCGKGRTIAKAVESYNRFFKFEGAE